MVATSTGPVIVQSDFSILLEVAAPGAESARDDLLRFAELVKSPEHVHTYRVTPLSLWNAASVGLDGPGALALLERHARFPVPPNVRAFVLEQSARFGRLVLVARGGELLLRVKDDVLALQLWSDEKLVPLLAGREGSSFLVPRANRGRLKQALVKLGWPVLDVAGYVDGSPIEVALRSETLFSKKSFSLRPYQSEAARAFWGDGDARAGAGTIVLPCGAGKTVVGIAALVAAKTRTLVLTTGTAAAKQWTRELLDKTTLREEDVLELTGETSAARKKAKLELAPVTVSTYQLLTHRAGDRYPHMEAIAKADLGLIIYDEVHLLPAPVFRLTADLQARRRLGLTATLVREDRLEDEVFSLVGPKRYDLPWKVLERAGWIAQARCTEVRVPLHPSQKLPYATAASRDRARVAAENPSKLPVLERLLAAHADEPVLVLGTYVEQIERAAALARVPIITGKTREKDRERLYAAFREGEVRVLVLSKVGNYAIDLPEASVAIQLSGNFGSRQEEAQRLGRILRPKEAGRTARFYTLVTRETVEQDFALRRQLFLTEQGYRYEIEDA